jgi:3-dehydroquinate synthase
MAEAVKVALIRDEAFFHWLVERAPALARFELSDVEQMIRRCAELHLTHIATGGDPFEQGNARPLDFGHWAAHKLEMMTRHAVRHGEAVAIGMALDARYAVEIGMLAEPDFTAIVDLLVALKLPVWHDALRDSELFAGLAEFREHLGGELCITLVDTIGRGVDVREVRLDLVRRAIDWLDAKRAA